MKTGENLFRPAAVIFDMDGLMFDTEKPFIRFWAELGSEFGYNIPQDIVMRMVGLNNESSRAVMYEEYGEDFPFDKMVDKLRLLYKKEREKGIPHKKGLLTLLDNLTAAKIPMGVATSTRIATATEMLRMAGVLDRFTAVTGGDEIKKGKPDPEIFLLAALRLGAQPSACVGFEDSPAGLAALHAAGIKSVFIKDLIEPPPDILSTVWRKCGDLAQAVQLFDI